MSEDAETLGGLTLILSGSFPREGDVFNYGDWRIKVVDLEEHRVKVLSLSRRKAEIDGDS